jgi:hypothetical protein
MARIPEYEEVAGIIDITWHEYNADLARGLTRAQRKRIREICVSKYETALAKIGWSASTEEMQARQSAFNKETGPIYQLHAADYYCLRVWAAKRAQYSLLVFELTKPLLELIAQILKSQLASALLYYLQDHEPPPDRKPSLQAARTVAVTLAPPAF